MGEAAELENLRVNLRAALERVSLLEQRMAHVEIRQLGVADRGDLMSEIDDAIRVLNEAKRLLSERTRS